MTSQPSDHRPSGQGTVQITIAKILVSIVQQAEVFHSPDGRTWATVEINGRQETWPIRSKGFRGWIGRSYYALAKKPAGTQAMTEALGLAEARALDGPEATVHVRVAEHEEKVYLDLADPQRRVAEVDADGWRILRRTPIKFQRSAGMLALPEPMRGGSLRELRPFVNVADEASWRLLVAWLVMALCPRGPYPVLVLGGEHGSAKSATAKLLRGLIDPNAAPTRAEPREARDLMIASRNGWVLAFDNISGVAGWLSDALCRLATGSGFATRQLYTDDDETIFTATRPIILNGIGEVVTREDLLDRTLVLMLPAIPEGKRREERVLERAFSGAWPRILGALLDAVSCALRNRDTIRFTRLPRMADFVRWVTAAEPALGWTAGASRRAYAANRVAAHAVALEASPIIPPLRAGMKKWGDDLQDTADVWLTGLEALASDKVIRSAGWPANARAFSVALRRLAPNLRAVGIKVTFVRSQDKARTRLIRITDMKSRRAARRAADEGADLQAADATDAADANSPTSQPEPQQALQRHGVSFP